jgi:hypothetical protein
MCADEDRQGVVIIDPRGHYLCTVTARFSIRVAFNSMIHQLD